MARRDNRLDFDPRVSFHGMTIGHVTPVEGGYRAVSYSGTTPATPFHSETAARCYLLEERANR